MLDVLEFGVFVLTDNCQSGFRVKLFSFSEKKMKCSTFSLTGRNSCKEELVLKNTAEFHNSTCM